MKLSIFQVIELKETKLFSKFLTISKVSEYIKNNMWFFNSFKKLSKKKLRSI
jgi:hypothetical protein